MHRSNFSENMIKIWIFAFRKSTWICKMMAILFRPQWVNSVSVNNCLEEKQQQDRHLLQVNKSSGCTGNRLAAKWQVGNNCMTYSYELVGYAGKFLTGINCWKYDIFLFITQLTEIAVNKINKKWARYNFLQARVTIYAAQSIKTSSQALHNQSCHEQENVKKKLIKNNQAWCLCVNIIFFIIINGLVMSCKK